MPVFFIDERLTPILLLREMFKSYNAFVLLAVPFFLLAANLMNGAGITDRLISFARALVGHLPGGLGHVNVTVSMLFAGISGSSTADAAGIGSLLIPQMKKEGYHPSFAVAITACSAVMGVIIPPSILMVVWGGLMSVSIGGLFLAGVVPGILIAAAQMITVYVYAKRYGYPVYARSTLKELGVAFLSSLAGADDARDHRRRHRLRLLHARPKPRWSPSVYSLFLGLFVYRTVTPTRLPTILYDSARFAALSLFCIGTASAFGWALAYFKIPAALVAQIDGLGLGVVGTGILVAAAFLLIGMFIDAIPAIIILGTVLWPVVEHVGMHPIHFAIIGIISLAFGLVTPPYGLCLLIAAAIGEVKLIKTLEGRRHHPPADARDPDARHPAARSHPGAAPLADAGLRPLAGGTRAGSAPGPGINRMARKDG